MGGCMGAPWWMCGCSGTECCWCCGDISWNTAAACCTTALFTLALTRVEFTLALERAMEERRVLSRLGRPSPLALSML